MTHDEFSKTIQAWLTRKGITKKQAAAELGISVRTLQNWEIARNMPRGFGLNALLGFIAERRDKQ